VILLGALLAVAGWAPASLAQNAITAENALPGAPASQWDVSGAGDASIQGFATEISVDRGETVRFKVDTPSTNYRLDIYRLGYYGGAGARLVATVQPSAPLPQSQPDCLSDPTTGLVDCGNWAESASWAVPANATSGIYLAKLVREDPENGRASHVAFVVRDDDGGSEILFQTSDTTWQAYNAYGGNSLYTGEPAGRAYKVSYNRPFTTRCCSFPGGEVYSWIFNAEYPMVRWLERNGYDVSYSTGVDADRRGAEILEHDVYMTVGHDEYWSGGQRSNVEAARDAGVHMAFLTGNEVFWKTRWEPSISASGTPYRTLVCYKETHANAKIDPLPGVWTGSWRDPRFGPHDGGRPENALDGTIFTVNGDRNDAMKVPAADGKMRLWRNTSIATLAPGATATLPAGVLGYEWDEDLDNGSRPPGLIRLSTTTVSGLQVLQDYGSSYGSGTATHHLTLYRHASGALVFGAGTVQWSWGLDASHDFAGTPVDARMQQATVNLLADMGVQPATLQTGLVAASASTDATPPAAVITAPANGSVLTSTPVTITGTASDAGGQVGGVEVSTDNGATWHPATGRGSWSYSWTPGGSGAATLRARAADDSANLGASSTPVGVTIGSAPLQSIAVTPASPTIAVGGTQQLTATGTFAGGATQDLTSQAVWASSLPGVAAVGATGLATGVAEGVSSLSATLGTVSGSTPVTVVPPGILTITTAALPGGLQGISYATTLAATGGTPPYSWSIASGQLPAGLTLAPGTGAISGTPTTTGLASFTVQVGAGAQTATQPLNIAISPPPSTVSVWPATTVPGSAAGSEPAVELGVKLRSDVAGYVTGIRFYKFSSNTGTHVGNLWTTGGQRLATATFANETPSGWQQVDFPTPAAIAANTTYVASYHCPNGFYAVAEDYFATLGVDAPPLHLLADGASGGNGVYRYAPTSSFPTDTYRSEYYWVDIVFSQTPPLQSIAVTPAAPTIPAGGTLQLTATGTYFGGGTQDLTSQAIWASSLPSVATVSATGMVSAWSPGGSSLSATLGTVTGSTPLTVVPPDALVVATTGLPNATKSTPYAATLTAGGGIPPYTWSLASGQLPAGLALAPGTGAISGTPTAAGVARFTVQVTAGAESATRDLAIAVLSSAECSDGVDSDGDGRLDYPADPGCTSPDDLSERSPTLPCDDGADDDGDGRADFDPATFANPLAGSGDLGCMSIAFGREDPPCQDGVDNDGDAGIDFDGGQSIHGACTGEPGGCPPGVSDPEADGVPNPDPTCGGRPQWISETSKPCGLGIELALLLPALQAWRRSRRSASRARGAPFHRDAAGAGGGLRWTPRASTRR